MCAKRAKTRISLISKHILAFEIQTDELVYKNFIQACDEKNVFDSEVPYDQAMRHAFCNILFCLHVYNRQEKGRI